MPFLSSSRIDKEHDVIVVGSGAAGGQSAYTLCMGGAKVLGKNGAARGVRFIDKAGGADHEAAARVVVLAASACETVRILLNAVYSPWWLYSEQHAGTLDFARGYHIEIGGGRRIPGVETMSGIEWLTGGSYGKRFKEDARRYYGSFVSFDGRGEMIPNEQSYCDIDPTVKDKWGIPVLRFHWQWSQHETRQAAHMQYTVAKAAQFFARFRDLTAGGFYSAPEGRQDLGYLGNVRQTKFDGPPRDVLRKLGLDAAAT